MPRCSSVSRGCGGRMPVPCLPRRRARSGVWSPYQGAKARANRQRCCRCPAPRTGGHDAVAGEVRTRAYIKNVLGREAEKQSNRTEEGWQTTYSATCSQQGRQSKCLYSPGIPRALESVYSAKETVCTHPAQVGRVHQQG